MPRYYTIVVFYNFWCLWGLSSTDLLIKEFQWGRLSSCALEYKVVILRCFLYMDSIAGICRGVFGSFCQQNCQIWWSCPFKWSWPWCKVEALSMKISGLYCMRSIYKVVQWKHESLRATLGEKPMRCLLIFWQQLKICCIAVWCPRPYDPLCWLAFWSSLKSSGSLTHAFPPFFLAT